MNTYYIFFLSVVCSVITNKKSYKMIDKILHSHWPKLTCMHYESTQHACLGSFIRYFIKVIENLHAAPCLVIKHCLGDWQKY